MPGESVTTSFVMMSVAFLLRILSPFHFVSPAPWAKLMSAFE
jgi:hypothetical protein